MSAKKELTVGSNEKRWSKRVIRTRPRPHSVFNFGDQTNVTETDLRRVKGN